MTMLRSVTYKKATQASWYRDRRAKWHPWVSMRDYPSFVLYGGAGTNRNNGLVRLFGGADVFIRKSMIVKLEIFLYIVFCFCIISEIIKDD